MFRALTIAGSDSGGGAGIQADLKTFCSLRVYGTTVITALTAQNTLGVSAIEYASPEIVAGQIEAVLSDIGTDACKTGMLGTAASITAVAQKLAEFHIDNLVVDPVMVAKGGAQLLEQDAVTALKDRLLPITRIITPNVPEAEVLSGCSINCPDDMIPAAAQLLKLGPAFVVIKGGHLEGDATDLVYAKDFTMFLRSPRIMTRCTHGTGCTFAAAIAAYLARGLSELDAIKCAKTYVTQAILTGTSIGKGHAPTNHFWNIPNPDSNPDDV